MFGEVSTTAIAVYAGFARYADNSTGQTFASRETVARLLKINLKTVRDALAELNKTGWIVTKRRGAGKTAFRYVRYRKQVKVTSQKAVRQDGPKSGPHNQTQSTITTQEVRAPSGEGTNIVAFRTEAA